MSAKTAAPRESAPIRPPIGAGAAADAAPGAPPVIGADESNAELAALLEGQHLAVRACPIGDLRGYARNARQHSPEQIQAIARSIREFGWTVPILADAEGEVIAGHGRLAAAQGLGLKHVPVVTLAHLSPAQRRALVLADNQLPLAAFWDEALLAAELADLADLSFDLDVIGFEADTLRGLLNLDVGEEALPDLAAGEKAPFQQVTFTLHETQLQRLRQALALVTPAEMAAQERVNTNRNGNALAALVDRLLAAAGENEQRAA
jgi:ParB-like chromosome segregation protein Spo0J